MTPKPQTLPRPKPARLPRRNRVTAILSLICTDGVLMLADTEETLSKESKSECDKLRNYLCPHGQVLLGAAGDSQLCEFAMRQIGLSLLQQERTWEEIETDLNELNHRIFRETIGIYQGLPADIIPNWIEMLIAVQTKNQVRVFEWRHTAVVPISGLHVSIGAGVTQMHPLLRDMQFSIPARCMLLLGVNIMRQTKRMVQGCGGKTEAVALHPTGSRTHYFSETTSKVEKFAEALSIQINELWWVLVTDPWGEKGDFSTLSAEFSKNMQGFREEYQRIMQ